MKIDHILPLVSLLSAATFSASAIAQAASAPVLAAPKTRAEVKAETREAAKSGQIVTGGDVSTDPLPAARSSARKAKAKAGRSAVKSARRASSTPELTPN